MHIQCNEIKLVDWSKGAVYVAYSGSDKGLKLKAMCAGPENTLLAWDEKNRAILKLQWNDDDKMLYQERKIKIPLSGFIAMSSTAMCYLNQENLIVMSSKYSHIVQAMNLETGDLSWQKRGKISEKEMNPCSICTDGSGRIYIADSWPNDRVLVLEAQSGEFVHEQTTDEISNICWAKNPDTLVVNSGHDSIKFYDTNIELTRKRFTYV